MKEKRGLCLKCPICESKTKVWEGPRLRVSPPLGSHSVVGRDVDGVGGRVVFDGQTQICDGRCAVLLHQDVLGLEVSVSNGGFSWTERGARDPCVWKSLRRAEPSATRSKHVLVVRGGAGLLPCVPMISMWR